MKGSDLFQRQIVEKREVGDYGELSYKVWSKTPWMVNAYIESPSNHDRHDKIMQWCYDNLGEQNFPFGKNPTLGKWRSGNAIVMGWGWMGFATEEMMNQFIEAWPNPTPSQ